MHKVVGDRISKNRARQILQQKRKTKIIEPNFEVEDFVLIRRAQKKGYKQVPR